MNSRLERGLSFPITIYLLSLSMLFLYATTFSVSRIAKASLITASTRDIEITSFLNLPQVLDETTTTGIFTIRPSPKNHNLRIIGIRHSTSDTYNSENGIFPAFNYAPLFSNATPCATSSSISERTPGGFLITNGSLVSEIICVNPDLTLKNAFLGNLYLIEPSVFEPAFEVFATGFIDIQGSITLKDDATIIAGGDVHISAIKALGNANITLLSSTGSIVVENAVGNVQFHALARSVYLPRPNNYRKNELVQEREITILGFETATP